jgi:DNA-binding protein HU-beta
LASRNQLIAHNTKFIQSQNPRIALKWCSVLLGLAHQTLGAVNNPLHASPISTTIRVGTSATTIRKSIHMNRKELINALADKTGSSKADADRSIAALIEIVTATLKKGDNVALVGFGTFEVRKRAARIGRNPATGAELKIKASKAPAFKAGATLKATVNGGK